MNRHAPCFQRPRGSWAGGGGRHVTSDIIGAHTYSMTVSGRMPGVVSKGRGLFLWALKTQCRGLAGAGKGDSQERARVTKPQRRVRTPSEAQGEATEGKVAGCRPGLAGVSGRCAGVWRRGWVKLLLSRRDRMNALIYFWDRGHGFKYTRMQEIGQMSVSTDWKKDGDSSGRNLSKHERKLAGELIHCRTQYF